MRINRRKKIEDERTKRMNESEKNILYLFRFPVYSVRIFYIYDEITWGLFRPKIEK